MTAAAASAAALFFVLWWMLQTEESPWVPAGLAASVVMLVAAFARLLLARRIRNQQPAMRASHEHSVRRPTLTEMMHSTSRHAAALRALQRQSAAADEKDSAETHREVYELCSEYLTGAERALASPALQTDGRVALRAGQERVRELRRHHLLTWARNSARALTLEAQLRVRLYDKVETANRALECLEQALRVYPDDADLTVSARAVNEFIASSRVAHWVELAERAAFKGYFQRAIDCYRDALYYLGRDGPAGDSNETAERILKEIDILRARMNAEDGASTGFPNNSRHHKRSTPEII